ncbi:hypothetical protein HZH68_007683 [Vespula germanica]|uniref:Uncharacterized protein n=1 Tax=Vespula germanica TaxID=30212 RepID=A0A834K844_VESGE|nr:hypothetical protein HZH68_007683 [Vespula germanica]
MEPKIRKRNPSTLTCNELTNRLADASKSIITDSCKNYCQHTSKVQKSYWDKGSLMENVLEMLSLQNNDSENDSGSDSSNKDTISENSEEKAIK